MQELRKSQPSLSPPGSPCLDQPSGKFLSFLAGLGTVDSIHWAAGSAGTRTVVSLAHRYIPRTPAGALLGGRRALQADGGKAGDADSKGAAGAGGPAEAEEQPRGKQWAGSFFQGAG